MIEIKFKKWLELFGQGIEPPVQDPEKLNNGAFPRYKLPPDDDLPPTPKNKKSRSTIRHWSNRRATFN